jgi:Protein of unknown function (DUF3667)
MSKKTYREDKTCLNCNAVVEQHFCPNCGQENTDTRKTFHHLFLHFFEDLTHYENAFWRTIKNLLFKPAALTQEYLSGKRLSYLAPVRLYIFISFVTFLLITMFSNDNKTELGLEENNKEYVNSEYISKETRDSINKIIVDSKNSTINKSEKLSKEQLEIKRLLNSKTISKTTKDTLEKIIEKAKNSKPEGAPNFMNFSNFGNIRELDSLRKVGKGNEKIGDLEYWLYKKILIIKEHNTEEEIWEKSKESFIHNFPKVLLIYMPFFAFFLWIFHGKKRWYYFDHGIFTLHYFSFLLLIYLILSLIGAVLNLIGDSTILGIIRGIILFFGIFWMFYYFFPAHHRFYGETRLVSFTKSIVLFFINMFFVLILLTLFAFYTFINLH